EHSVGRYMTPETVAVRHHMSAEEALAVVRRKGADAETVYTLPVIDDRRCLHGIVSLRDLVLSAPERPVSDIAIADTPQVHATDDVEEAARLMQDTNVLALPVTDSENRVLGLLTIDDAFEVIEAADTED